VEMCLSKTVLSKRTSFGVSNKDDDGKEAQLIEP